MRSMLLCRLALSFLFLTVEAGTMIMTKTKEAYFAGGCFWGIEKLFKKVEGVTSKDVGYIGGTKESPSYSDVTSGV